MAVISVRFNDSEAKILKHLAAEFEMDQSALIKKSIMDTYEDLIDRQVIEAYEKDEARKKPVFHSFEEIIKSVPNRKGK